MSKCVFNVYPFEQLLIRLAFTRKKLAIAWAKVLDILLASNCSFYV